MWNVFGGIYSNIIQLHIHRKGCPNLTLWQVKLLDSRVDFVGLLAANNIIQWFWFRKTSWQVLNGLNMFKQQRVALLWAKNIKTTSWHSPKLLGPFTWENLILPELHWIAASFFGSIPSWKISKKWQSKHLPKLNRYKVKSSFHSKGIVKTSFNNLTILGFLSGIPQASCPQPPPGNSSICQRDGG